MLKNRINRYLLLSFFSIVLVFLKANLVFALEVSLPGLGTKPQLGDYVKYFFAFGIAVAGILALISFTIGAIGLINPNIESHNNAKDRMKGSIFGLVIILSSYLIIQTINPKITELNITPGQQNTISSVEQPGVYYYAVPGCEGTPVGFDTNSQDNLVTKLQWPSDPKAMYTVISVKIVNAPDRNIYYGVIFHEEPGLKNGGLCTLPIIDEGCHPVGMPAGSRAADIFNLDKTPITSGSGVNFYSEPFGPNTGSNAGFYFVKSNEITSPFLEFDLKNNPEKMCFFYTNVNVPDPYMFRCTDSVCNDMSGGMPGWDCSDTACETFQDCPGSIKINGSYLIALYSSGNYCQTFQNVVDGIVPNLEAQPFLAAGSKYLESIYIIPYR